MSANIKPTVNLFLIASQGVPDLCDAVCFLARMLIRTPYMTVGSYFKTINPEHLSELLEFANILKSAETAQPAGNDSMDRALLNILYLAELLAYAEGIEPHSEDEAITTVSQALTFIYITDLGKRDLIGVFWENFSFANDLGDLPICCKKEA